jgi:nucleoside-diphosphate-sugar epimerase
VLCASAALRPRSSAYRQAFTAKANQGFIRRVIEFARQSGVSSYIGDGANRWPAVSRLDAAALYRIAMETADLAPVYHAVGNDGATPFKQIATIIGRKLGLPLEPRAPEHFGFLATLVAGDMPASSQWTPKDARLETGPSRTAAGS